MDCKYSCYTVLFYYNESIKQITDFPCYFKGYVPEKFGNREYQNRLFKPNSGYICVFSLIVCCLPLLFGPRIVTTANSKTANNEGHLYI